MNKTYRVVDNIGHEFAAVGALAQAKQLALAWPVDSEVRVYETGECWRCRTLRSGRREIVILNAALCRVNPYMWGVVDENPDDEEPNLPPATRRRGDRSDE